MSRLFLILGVLLACSPSALAQRAPFDPPIVNRPDDFSNIVGKYTIEAAAVPTEVHVEEPITLTISITGEGPPKYEPNRKFLHLFPAEWEKDFYVQELHDEHRQMRDKKTWLFVYQLKPKHTRIEEIGDIKLVYYDPGRKGYSTQFVDKIPLRVKPKPATTPDIPLAAAVVPDSFYQCASVSQVLAPHLPWANRSAVEFAGMLVGPPLACLLAVIAWRRYFPDDRQRRRHHRSRAGERALRVLETGPQAAWRVVGQFLRERFDFPTENPTPAEVADFLNRRGFAKEVCEQARALFQAGDAICFAADGAADARELARAAACLIRVLEADRCAR